MRRVVHDEFPAEDHSQDDDHASDGHSSVYDYEEEQRAIGNYLMPISRALAAMTYSQREEYINMDHEMRALAEEIVRKEGYACLLLGSEPCSPLQGAPSISQVLCGDRVPAICHYYAFAPTTRAPRSGI